MDAFNNFDEQKRDDKNVINTDSKEPLGIDGDILSDIMVDIINDKYRGSLPFEIKERKHFYLNV